MFRIWLRMLPAGMQDRALEKKYLAVMGTGVAAEEVMPGGTNAAVGEATQA